MAVPRQNESIDQLRHQLHGFASVIEHKFDNTVNRRHEITPEYMHKVIETLGLFYKLVKAEKPSQRQTEVLQRINEIQNRYSAAVSYYSDPQGLRHLYYRDIGWIAEHLHKL